jgi:hypothetical protein
MTPHLAELAVSIVRFVDEYQPGIGACELVDAEGRKHTFIDKVPILTDEQLDAHSEYPRPGTIRCTVLNSWKDAQGRELVSLSTANPYHVESIDGLSEFVVRQNQVSAVPGPAS